jgi:hypothetical protein
MLQQNKQTNNKINTPKLKLRKSRAKKRKKGSNQKKTKSTTPNIIQQKSKPHKTQNPINETLKSQ